MKKYLYQLNVLVAFLTLGCSNNHFSVAPVSNQFKQHASVNNKVDIIWVVDSSLTMATHQASLANNFETFINQFVEKGFDYHIVVTSTDAWVREIDYNLPSWCNANPNPGHSPSVSYVSSADCHSTYATYGDMTYFRDGDIYGSSTGVMGARSGNFMLTSAMDSAQVIQDFKTNVKVGTRGDGARENLLQSLRATLRRNSDGSVGYGGESHTVLSQFRRDDAFLAVIVVSDEEEQSKRQDDSAYANIADFQADFLSFMDGYTASSAGDRKYSVSGIVVNDIATCQGLHPQATQGDRYVAIAGATRGVVGDICSADFASHLNGISQKIITLASRFKISRVPNPDTIVVKVDDVVVAQNSENGWSYFSEGDNHYIEFNGSSVPQEDSSITVNFDPASIL